MPTHEYPINVSWHGGRDGGGEVHPGQGQSLELKLGQEYGGPGGGTNPELLLTSAVASCYTITFGIISANKKLPVQSVKVDAVGEVEQNGPSFVFTKITIRPEIVLESGASDDQLHAATDAAHKAEAYCIITNAVRDKVKVELEPKITVAG